MVERVNPSPTVKQTDFFFIFKYKNGWALFASVTFFRNSAQFLVSKQRFFL